MGIEFSALFLVTSFGQTKEVTKKAIKEVKAAKTKKKLTQTFTLAHHIANA